MNLFILLPINCLMHHYARGISSSSSSRLGGKCCDYCSNYSYFDHRSNFIRSSFIFVDKYRQTCIVGDTDINKLRDNHNEAFCSAACSCLGNSRWYEYYKVYPYIEHYKAFASNIGTTNPFA